VRHIKHLLDVVDEVRDHVALGLISDPGLSKTAQVKQWAEEHNRTYCELIISQRMPSEISGMPMPVPDSHTMEIFDFQTLLNLKDGDVLAFDEFTNGNIQTLNACLTLIQERTMLSGRKLPSLLIVAMGNPQGRCELLPQTKQRFWWVDVHWDNVTWTRYMKKQWGISVSKLVTALIDEQYKRGFAASGEYNYYTPRTVENLFRIAQKIDRDSTFWTMGDLTPVFVDGLYASLNNLTTFAQINDKVKGWFDSVDGTLEQPADGDIMVAFMADVMSCGGIDDFREFLTTAESNPVYVDVLPKFVEYLKETELDKKFEFGD
jgi:hypothetical protein